MSQKTTISHSLIGADLRITGDLHSDGGVIIEGQVQGNVVGETVKIVSGATVLGDVSARDLIIDGSETGTVQTGTVKIGPQAIFEGELQCDHFEIAKGAQIYVKFNMVFNEPLKLPLPA
jgi:cytoskeletal protein CcmA (bactofilin family)